jgi:hypothetical protein
MMMHNLVKYLIQTQLRLSDIKIINLYNFVKNNKLSELDFVCI